MIYRNTDVDPMRIFSYVLALAGYLFLLGVLVWAVRFNVLDMIRAGLTGLLGGITTWLFAAFVESMRLEGGPKIESYWGGLGGGIGGWRCSTSLVYLGGLLGCALLMVLLYYPLINIKGPLNSTTVAGGAGTQNTTPPADGKGQTNTEGSTPNQPVTTPGVNTTPPVQQPQVKPQDLIKQLPDSAKAEKQKQSEPKGK